MKQTFRFPEDRYIAVGTVTKTRGLDGEVTVSPWSEQPENFRHYPTLHLVDREGTLSPELQVEKLRIHKGKVVIKFDRVPDRSFAEKLVGMQVLLARENLPELDSREYYWRELTGKDVLITDGTRLGTVESMFSNGAQDILVVTGDNREFLIPITDTVVTTVRGNEIIIDPPPGLLDINLEDG